MKVTHWSYPAWTGQLPGAVCMSKSKTTTVNEEKVTCINCLLVVDQWLHS